MIAIGIGGNSRAKVDDFELALDEFCREAGGCDVVATFDKASCLDIARQAASRRGLEFRALPFDALVARSEECLTRSAKTLEILGVASVAEASALAAAGAGSRLRVARRIIGNITMAAAESHAR